ncbi:transpeptidase family protein [candidate division KSB1 bacterium]|nr:transpeptidase family protein [candidate division KSB1 bacterium]
MSFDLNPRGQHRAPSQKLKERLSNRALQFTATLTILILVVLFRAFAVQVLKRDPWISLSGEQYEQRVKLPAARGLILDRHNRILAMDLSVTHLAADPSLIEDRDAVSRLLEEVLGQKRDVYLDLLDPAKYQQFSLIQKNLTEQQKEVLLKSSLRGLIFQNDQARIHPYNALARQVIGITDQDDRGVGGVEQTQDVQLRGEDGWAIYQKDGHNRRFPSLELPSESPVNGYDLVLTLDYSLQALIEEELKKGVNQHHAKSGCAVLVDPFRGDVLAMATSWPDGAEETMPFAETIQNLNVQWDFEPGSTFKIVTIAAALEEGLYESNSLVHCENGKYKLAGHVIHDHEKEYDWLSLSQIVEYSSNIGAAKIAKKMGKDVLYKYAQNFGFGNRTSIAFPGETPGILRPSFKWNSFATATTAFGQGLSCTSLQLAMMTAAIANGGELLAPQIIQSVRNPEGIEVAVSSKKVIRRVISERTASEVRMILERVVSQGSGKLAGVERLPVAGKTGTAQKSVSGYRGYLPNAYVSSFVGFWPVLTPRYVLVVVLDEPQQMYWGSQSAAPIFSAIVSRISGLPLAPGVASPTMRRAENNDPFIFSSMNHPNPEVEQSNNISVAASSIYHVPHMTGLSLRDAMRKLSEIGIQARIDGNGVVKSQDPPAGTRITPDTVCRLICEKIL